MPAKPESSSRMLPDREWAEFNTLIAKTDFWSLNAENSVLQANGASVHLEGCKNGAYKAIRRDVNMSDVAELVRYFLSVGPSVTHED